MPRPVGIDLFAGAGGLSLGFEQAGFDIVAAVELDPIHGATHKFNFPECFVLPYSISELTGTDIRAKAGLGRRRIDVVFGGAPCQGFSMMGQRVMDDPRNSLVRDFVRIVSELKPAYFVFENVKGLSLGEHRIFLEQLIRAFEDAGYQLRSPWRVLDAADYGVPQHRERLILMGARKGESLPDYPVPVFCPADTSQFGSLKRGPSCRDALGDLPDAELFDELFLTDEIQTRAFKSPSEYARGLRCVGNNAWHDGYRREWNKMVLTSSLRTSHTTISRRRFAQTEPGQVEPISRFFKLHPEGLSNTLRAGTDSARGAFTSPRPIHYEHPRCVTVREMARLHGFPDWFRFHATKWHGARQVGNSVPPPLARAVANRIAEALGVERGQPERSVHLGDPALLKLDMSGAADYFEVPIPIRKRDRKSGAKKRKQYEIEAYREPRQMEISFA